MTSVASVSQADMCREAYRFDLPEGSIAQEAVERGASRLMVLDRVSHEGLGDPVHARFGDLARYLPAGALLVANNSRVVPVRLLGKRPTGGAMELLLLTPLPLVEAGAVRTSGLSAPGEPGEKMSAASVCGEASSLVDTGVEAGAEAGVEAEAEADVLLKPARAMKVGQEVCFAGETPDDNLVVTVLEKGEFGRHRVRLRWKGAQPGSLRRLFERRGHLPLPPYIRRPDTASDVQRYQTVYAREDRAGSAAAPTAGLHFAPGMREELEQQGFGWAEVTLHVGYGTFSPVRCDDIREHVMHAEYVEVTAETARKINEAKRQGRPIIAVGTTACRTLEGVAQTLAEAMPSAVPGTVPGTAPGTVPGTAYGAEAEQGHEQTTPLIAGAVAHEAGCSPAHEAASKADVLAPYAGWINMFIWPGYRFRVIDGLITNFHLPESTLLMLVSALTGRERLLAAYGEAVQRDYRFFSYGDAMLIR